MKAAVITDSTATLSEEIAQLPNVFEVTFSVRFTDGTEMPDSNDEPSIRKFYEKLHTEPGIPKTSQPSLNQYYDIYDQLEAEGYDTVFFFTMPGALSGANQTAHMIANEMEERGIKTYVYDTHAVCYINERFVQQALELIDAGVEAEEIDHKMKWAIDHTRVYLIADNLDYLAKTGRLSTPVKLLGKALKICPILTINEKGEIVIMEKIRTVNRALKRVAELAQERAEKFKNDVHVIVGHGDAPDKYESVLGLIDEKVKRLDLRKGYITPVIGVYTGLGSVGVGVIPSLSNVQ